uniref:Uncharacterized protein n=1 Tax=Guillardia theta TaxID=55529 RepID=A0A7S4UH05_GUITH|mmetsp:Transcript_49243/g.154518  ORF Transcript_49243/g.154518 Transcript_49243/m.154518 type:complete len:113 (+) Transcript_49243:59-397(+)
MVQRGAEKTVLLLGGQGCRLLLGGEGCGLEEEDEEEEEEEGCSLLEEESTFLLEAERLRWKGRRCARHLSGPAVQPHVALELQSWQQRFLTSMRPAGECALQNLATLLFSSP